MIPYPKLDPRKVSTWTLKANICTTGRQRGVSWCREKCENPCEWAEELAYREGLPPKPKPPEKPYVNKVKKARKRPELTRKKGILGRIPYFTAWLRDLKESGRFATWMELAEKSGVTRSSISKTVRDDHWTREFETKIIAALGLTEAEATVTILKWAKDNGLEGDET